MTQLQGKRSLLAAVATAALLLGGCGEKPRTQGPPPERANRASNNGYTPYVPPTQPAEAQPQEDLPTQPRDAQPVVTLTYSVEIWEILLPEETVTSDEAFWKRVNEQAVDLSTHDVLYKNGFRVGELPMRELGMINKLIEDRKATRTQIVGIAGKQLEIPIKANIEQQTLFYFNRSNRLIGRTFDKCDNVLYFSFETTPRNPDQIRLALTPAVRGKRKQFIWAVVPGKADRELTYATEESIYDASLRLDLPLRSALVVAPSLDARSPSTLGGTFMTATTPSERRERLLVIIPHAYTKDAPEPAPNRK